MNEKNKLFFETTLEKWSDLSLLNYEFISKYVFRGQANSGWSLQSSLERFAERNNPLGKNAAEFYEMKMLEAFKWKYPLYEDTPKPDKDEDIEWLSIMQHYGAPTRMLDFTYSLYVAVFMAMKDCFEGSASIWCIRKDTYYLSHVKDIVSKIKPAKDDGIWIPGNDVDSFIYNEANMRLNGRFVQDDRPNVYFVKPRYTNKRINVQQGLFAIPGMLSVPFEENIMSVLTDRIPLPAPFSYVIQNSNMRNSTDEMTILKIIIPHALRKEIMKALYQMNITDETLFPGLEGLAKSLTIPFLE